MTLFLLWIISTPQTGLITSTSWSALPFTGVLPLRALITGEEFDQLLRISQKMVQNLQTLLQPPPKPFARICMHVQKGRQI